MFKYTCYIQFILRLIGDIIELILLQNIHIKIIKKLPNPNITMFLKYGSRDRPNVIYYPSKNVVHAERYKHLRVLAS
jgi:hypothetical protein